MSKDEFSSNDFQEDDGLILRYKEMVAGNKAWYFDIDELDSIIDHYFVQNDLKRALFAAQYALKLFPNHGLMNLRVGQIFGSMGNLKSALTRVKSVIDSEPFNPEAHLTLASICSQLNDHDTAIKHFKKALTLEDDEMRDEIYMDLAMEYQNAGRFDEAIQTLKEALDYNPENEGAMFELSYCYDALDKLEDVIVFYQSFLDEHPYSSSTWYNLGNTLLRLEKEEEAVSAFEYCLAITEDFTPAQVNLGNAQFRLGNFDLALDAYTEAMEREGRQPTLLCYVGECYEKLDEPAKAISFYDECLKKDPQHTDAWVGKCVACEMQHKPEAALQCIERAYELRPKDPDVGLMLVELYSRISRYEDAEKICERIVRQDPQHIDAWLELTNAQYCMNEYILALNTIEKALGENPNDSSLLYRKVAYLHASGKRKEALLLLEYLVNSEFTDPSQLAKYYPRILAESQALDILKSSKY
jgi:tetratricopeptide (TPR) repeat protein